MPTRPSKLLGKFDQAISPNLTVVNAVDSLVLAMSTQELTGLSVAIGIVCTDGVVLGVERLLHSKLLVKGSNRRIQSADEHIGLATAGLLADGKHIGSRARDEAANFRDTYNSPVTVGVSPLAVYLRCCVILGYRRKGMLC